MVIIKEDNTPPSKWIIGRIMEVFYGKNNKVRVCTVKTKDGIFKRSVTKLCILSMKNKN